METLYTQLKGKIHDAFSLVMQLGDENERLAKENRELRSDDALNVADNTIVKLRARETENTAIIAKQSEDIKEFESLIEGYRQNIHRLESNVAGYKDDIRDMNVTIFERNATIDGFKSVVKMQAYNIEKLEETLVKYRKEAEDTPNLSYGRVLELEKQNAQLIKLNGELTDRVDVLESVKYEHQSKLSNKTDIGKRKITPIEKEFIEVILKTFSNLRM